MYRHRSVTHTYTHTHTQALTLIPGKSFATSARQVLVFKSYNISPGGEN